MNKTCLTVRVAVTNGLPLPDEKPVSIGINVWPSNGLLSPYEWNILEQIINKLQSGYFPLKAKIDTNNISGVWGC